MVQNVRNKNTQSYQEENCWHQRRVDDIIINIIKDVNDYTITIMPNMSAMKDNVKRTRNMILDFQPE